VRRKWSESINTNGKVVPVVAPYSMIALGPLLVDPLATPEETLLKKIKVVCN
jgi:hypothetical protein